MEDLLSISWQMIKAVTMILVLFAAMGLVIEIINHESRKGGRNVQHKEPEEKHPTDRGGRP
jgi:hypothetical protein